MTKLPFERRFWPAICHSSQELPNPFMAAKKSRIYEEKAPPSETEEQKHSSCTGLERAAAKHVIEITLDQGSRDNAETKQAEQNI